MAESVGVAGSGDLNIRRLLRSPLSWRIAITVFAAIIVIEAFVLVPSYLNRKASLIHERETLVLNTLLAMLAGDAAQDRTEGLPDDHYYFALAAKGLTAIQATGLVIFDGSGGVIYAYGDAPRTKSIAEEGGVTGTHPSPKRDLYDVVWPPDQTGFPWTVAVRLDVTGINGHLRSYLANVFALVLLISTFITAVTLVALWPSVLRPVILLAARQRSLGDNPFDHHGEIPAKILRRRDEIGDLYRAFQGMQAQIATSMGAVNQARLELESQVAERTAELKSVNEQLTDQIAVSNAASIRFRTFADSAADWYWEMDADLRFSYLSDRFEEITGASPHNLLGKSPHETIIPGIEPEDWHERLESLVNHEPFRNFTYPRVKDGETVWLRVNGIPIFDDSGRFQGYLGTGTDVTKEKLIEQLLQQSTETMREAMEEAHAAEQRLLTAIGSLNDAFVLFDADDRLVLCNHKYREFYGSSQELLAPGSRLEDIIRANAENGEIVDAIGRVDEWVTERLANHRADHWVGEQRLSNGRWLKIDERKTPDGGTVGFRVDITELKNTQAELNRAKEEAEAANLAKSQFLAAMSHEIRTPLACMTGMADLLMDSPTTPQQLECVRSIRSSSEDLLQILSQILDQSKLEAGKLDMDPIDFHLPTLIHDTTRLFAPKIAEKGLELEINTAESLPTWVHADRLRIAQVFTNFLSNALKFTELGTITVSVDGNSLDGERCLLRFEVADSGIGMDQQTCEKLFSPFVQADSTTSRKYGGTGLGLSISKQLVEMAGGEIGVTSSVGTGSAFWFTIPCEPVQGPTELPATRPQSVNWVASRPLNILFAEDNLVNQQLVTAIFEKLGHRVDVADHGMMALERLETSDYDLVLMDIRMPVMDGLETTAIIRAMDESTSGIPIIALTADIAAGNIKDYLAAGMNDVCAKPIDLAHLLSTIDTQLGEEIHTPAEAGPVVVESRKTPVEGAPVPVPDGIDFGHVLEQVSDLVDRQISDTRNQVQSPGNPLIDPDTFSTLVARYEEDLIAECRELQAEFSHLAASPDDDQRRFAVKNLFHAMKGAGSSFGYPLVTKIATQADTLLKQDRALEKDDIDTLSHHVEALSLIADKRIFGDGGKAGSLLLRGLQSSYGLELT